LYFITLPFELLSFQWQAYDLNRPLTEQITPSIKNLENVNYVKRVINKFSLAISKSPENIRLYELRNLYTYILWYISPKGEMRFNVIKQGLRFSQETVRKFPDSPDGWLFKGSFLSFYGLGKGVLNSLYIAKDLIDIFRKSYKLDKTHLCAQSVLALGTTFYLLPHFPVSFGNTNLAKKYFMEAIIINPNFPYGYVHMAEVEASEGNIERALNYLLRLRNITPTTWFQQFTYKWALKALPAMEKELKKEKWDKYHFNFFDVPIVSK